MQEMMNTGMNEFSLQSIIDSMQQAFSMSGGSAGLSAVFLACLMVLWKEKFESRTEIKQLFTYAIIMLVVIISPVYLIGVRKFLPELYSGNMYLWILPVVPVTMYATVIIVSKLDSRFKKFVFVVGLFGIMILATTTSYNQNDIRLVQNNQYNKQYVDESVIPVLDKVKEYKASNKLSSVKIWGPDEVMAEARKYDGSITILYGQDYYDNQNNTKMVQVYGEWCPLAYELMKHDVNYLGDIAYLAGELNVDAIILKSSSFINSDMKLPRNISEEYSFEYADGYYCLYTRNNANVK